MHGLRQIYWSVVAVWMLMIGAAALTGNGIAIALFGLTLLGSSSYVLNLARWRRLRLALVQGDAARARALWRRVYARLDGRERLHPRVQLWRAYVSVLGGHYPPALAILEALTKVRLGPREEAARDSLRARCLAQGNNPESAIAVVDQARALPNLSHDSRRALTEALAIARLRLRQPELTLKAVDELLADPARTRSRASHLVVRGDALRMMGRESEAREAYDESLRASERGTAGWRRARERLEQAPPQAYR